MTIEIVWNHLVFEETAIGICDALFMCGFDSDVRKVGVKNTDFRADVLYVVLGLHRFVSVPPKYIAVQAEQIGSKWMTDSYIDKLRKALCVLDFSPRNCSYFREKGIVCYNIGTRIPMEIFVEGSCSLTTHFSGREQDVDVLFYGARCKRRESLERDFQKSGLRVVFRYNDLFSDEREKLISRSKVVLNIHYWPSSSLETHRVEYLCSRGKCILSENSSDPDLDSLYSGSVAFVPYGGLVKAAQSYVADDRSRQTLETNSQSFSFRNQTDVSMVQKVLTKYI